MQNTLKDRRKISAKLEMYKIIIKDKDSQNNNSIENNLKILIKNKNRTIVEQNLLSIMNFK